MPLVTYSVPRLGTQAPTLCGVLAPGAPRKTTCMLLILNLLTGLAMKWAGGMRLAVFVGMWRLRFRAMKLRGVMGSSRLHRQNRCWPTVPLVKMPLETVNLTKLVGVTTRMWFVVRLLLETRLWLLLKRLLRAREQTIVIRGRFLFIRLRNRL